MNLKMIRSSAFTVVFAFVIVLVSASPAFAADLGDWGWGDYGTYDTWGDYGTYDTWSDYGTYDNWSDYGTYDNWSDYGTYSTGGTYYDDVTGTYYDDVSGTYYDDVTGTYYDDVTGTYYDDYYYDSQCSCYSYGSGSYSSNYGGYGGGYSVGGKSYMPAYSSSGYSMVKPMSFGAPSYAAPRPTSGGSVSNITNTTVTNVDNSINDSFNNYNSNNIAYVAPATPQYPVVYAQNPACQIYQAQTSGSVYLSWTSTNATSAYLSNVGTVNVNGSQTVWPTNASTYVLTVYGANGQQATCQTSVNAAPYVSLSQIPYTGFDFGTFGNAIYFATLAVFAIGAGYLAVYYIPALAFAGIRREKKFAPVVAPMAPILLEKELAAAKVSPIVNAIRKSGTNDAMAIVASKDGSMPKIVISRD